MTIDVDSYLRQIYQNATQSPSQAEQGPPSWAPAWGYRRKKRRKVMTPGVTLAPPPAARYPSTTTATVLKTTAPLPLGKTPTTTKTTTKTGTAAKKPATNTPAADAWRRQMPTNVTDLLRQLSVNVGELGMPGGYVGAVQLPAYGSGGTPTMTPDMLHYGQQPNLGEATFYQQSMKGGMTPIAAMSPLGVPQGWNPLGTTGGSGGSTGGTGGAGGGVKTGNGQMSFSTLGDMLAATYGMMASLPGQSPNPDIVERLRNYGSKTA